MVNTNIPVVARLLMPDDCNLAGNVHGGTILRMVEEAGMISASRHFNNNPLEEGSTETNHQGEQYAGLARMESMAFHQPVFVGEVASLTTQLVFTSEKSVLVKFIVMAENVTKGTKRITNTGLLWYLSFVPQGRKEPLKLAHVPQIAPPKDDDTKALAEYNKAKSLYDARKNLTQDHSCMGPGDGCFCPNCRGSFKPSSNAKTPAESKQILSQMVLPGDCGTSKIAFGGFVMKLMDTAAGCCAYKHARTNVVTVSLSAMDFVSMICLGDIVSIHAKISFCSAKSMEITVSAYVTSMTREEHLVAKGTFSFVSLDEKNKVQLVPGLKYETEEEFDLAFSSQVRYENAKKERLAMKK